MIEYLLINGAIVSSDKFKLPQELDCHKNYAIVCQLDNKDYPWEYPFPKVMFGVNNGETISISDTSSPSTISITLI